jgi:hypothetical protein
VSAEYENRLKGRPRLNETCREGNQKSIDSTVFHIEDAKDGCKMLQVYKNKGGLKMSWKLPPSITPPKNHTLRRRVE